MHLWSILLLGGSALSALAYVPSIKDPILSESLLREVVDRMGNDLDSYLDEVGEEQMFLPQLMARADKEPFYQDSPNPSIRDQEYVQHSTLWSNRYSEGGNEKEKVRPHGKHMNKEDNLPAYCNPPNPCPVGYTSAEGCLEDFQNSAEFSREFQAQQECMCDSEHMLDCTGNEAEDISDMDINRIIEQLHVKDEHKNLVAKKFHVKKSGNPFLTGERLPVAAKKGFNLMFY